MNDEMAGPPKTRRRFAPARPVFAIALSLFFAVCAVSAAGEAGIVFRDPSPAWTSLGGFPVFADVRSETGGTVQLTLFERNGDNTVTRNASLPAGASARLEMTGPSRGFSASAEGVVTASRQFSWSSLSRDYLNGAYPAPLACLNSFLLRELELLDESAKKEHAIHRALSLEDLPGRWQTYPGFFGMLVMDSREARTLRPEQQEAVARWVCWFGGRIWLVGVDAAEAARELGLATRETPDETLADGAVAMHRYGNGAVYLQAETDAGVLAANIPSDATTNPLNLYFGDRYSMETPGEWLRQGLGGVSTGIIVASLALLGVIMGPLNYWFIRRRNNSLLFFITTPLIAVGGALAIMAGSFTAEGLGGTYNQFAILARNAVSDDAMLFDMRGVRPGFFAPSPKFSADVLALPVRAYRERAQRSTDMTDGLALAAGWLRPRFPTGFVLVRPVVSRMNVGVTLENGEYVVTNDLGFAVEQVAARLPDGQVGWAENIAPGTRKILRREDGLGRLRNLYYRTQRLTDESPAFAGVSLVARCEGLPYLEDGGMNVRLENGEYYYMVTGDTEGVGP